jgi:hypothetical protein
MPPLWAKVGGVCPIAYQHRGALNLSVPHCAVEGADAVRKGKSRLGYFRERTIGLSTSSVRHREPFGQHLRPTIDNLTFNFA